MVLGLRVTVQIEGQGTKFWSVCICIGLIPQVMTCAIEIWHAYIIIM